VGVASAGQLERAVRDRFGAQRALLVERHATQLRFAFARTEPLGRILEFVLEQQGKHGVLLDYALRQTTLDEVFVALAAQQQQQHE